MILFSKEKFGIYDIIVHEGKRISTDLLDFESDCCGYTNNGLNWERGNGTKSDQWKIDY